MKQGPPGHSVKLQRLRLGAGIVLLGILLTPAAPSARAADPIFAPPTFAKGSSGQQKEPGWAPDVLALDLDSHWIYFKDPMEPELETFFDIDADGQLENTGWILGQNGDGFLWLDGNNNRKVDGVQEFFGPESIGPQGKAFDVANGFEALAQYDRQVYGGNGDGRIDSQDGVWRRLRLWLDENNDGESQPHEIQRPAQHKIEWFGLDYVEASDWEGRNRVVAKGSYWDRDLRRTLREREMVAIRFRFGAPY